MTRCHFEQRFFESRIVNVALSDILSSLLFFVMLHLSDIGYYYQLGF